MSTISELDAVRQSAILLALEAGRLLRDRVGRYTTLEFKGEIDLVTEVDKASEALIAEGIAAQWPGHAIMGEEGSSTGVAVDGAEWVWIVDPIDGTTNFAHGYPHFCVSIAVARGGEGVVGVIYDPNRDELFVGQQGRGAELNGHPIAVSDTASLKRSILATGFSYSREHRHDQIALWTTLHDSCQGIRREGSAALGMAWMAAGRTDGFYEKPINPWDIGAGAVIAASAGATITSYAGGPYSVFDREIVASNPHIHEELRSAINIGTPGEP